MIKLMLLSSSWFILYLATMKSSTAFRIVSASTMAFTTASPLNPRQDATNQTMIYDFSEVSSGLVTGKIENKAY